MGLKAGLCHFFAVTQTVRAFFENYLSKIYMQEKGQTCGRHNLTRCAQEYAEPVHKPNKGAHQGQEAEPLITFRV